MVDRVEQQGVVAIGKNGQSMKMSRIGIFASYRLSTYKDKTPGSPPVKSGQQRSFGEKVISERQMRTTLNPRSPLCLRYCH